MAVAGGIRVDTEAQLGGRREYSRCGPGYHQVQGYSRHGRAVPDGPEADGDRSVQDHDRLLMILALFILLLLLGTGSALDVQVSEEQHPIGAVLLVVDGLGASYVYPEREFSPYTMDGIQLSKTILFNLTGDGARVLDMRSRVPETLKSHSIIVAGSVQADSESLGRTIFDVAHENGYLSLAILQHADFREMLIRQDGVLYFGNNSIYNANASLSAQRRIFLLIYARSWRDGAMLFPSMM